MLLHVEPTMRDSVLSVSQSTLLLLSKRPSCSQAHSLCTGRGKPSLQTKRPWCSIGQYKFIRGLLFKTTPGPSKHKWGPAWFADHGFAFVSTLNFFPVSLLLYLLPRKLRKQLVSSVEVLHFCSSEPKLDYGSVFHSHLTNYYVKDVDCFFKIPFHL